jgi:hypothetical protein
LTAGHHLKVLSSWTPPVKVVTPPSGVNQLKVVTPRGVATPRGAVMGALMSMVATAAADGAANPTAVAAGIPTLRRFVLKIPG